MDMSRRGFIRRSISVCGVAALDLSAASGTEEVPSTVSRDDTAGAIVICNHWTQYGIGEAFPEGEVGGRWYRRNFSTVFALEQGRRWLDAHPANRICHELDAYFLESLHAEAPDYLAGIRDLVDRGKMEFPGGTFGQPQSQVLGYESALRQLTFGQAAYRRYLGRGVDTFLAEEQNFFPQLPQLLKLAGFKYASLQFQNSGAPPPLPHDLVLWEALDGTAIPTVPKKIGMLPCTRQFASYEVIFARLAKRKAPLIFQWMEVGPPGMDWGASIEPYREAIREAEKHGFQQMTLTEYIEWALPQCETPRVRIPMDRSNYNNNGFRGGWGYGNEQTTRGSNRCESVLLAVEALCAGGYAPRVDKLAGNRLRELWSYLLVSQNHDPYLVGAGPAYVDGLRSYQSELAVKQHKVIRQAIQDEAGMGEPIAASGASFRLFNPCPWDVATPVLLELNDLAWPSHAFKLTDGQASKILPAVFRSDSGHVLAGPIIARLPSYGTLDLNLEPDTDEPSQPNCDSTRLTAKQDGRVWNVDHEAFAGIAFEPLVGEWDHSYVAHNMNIEAAYKRIKEAPVHVAWRAVSDGIDVAAWRRDLMRIRDVEEPALSVQGLVCAGAEPGPWIQFNHRLTTTLFSFETGDQPSGTWRFRVHIAGPQPRIVADAPFSEEERRAARFYCARYVRLEWPGRHLLWCPSQNTLFRLVEEGKTQVIECTVLNFGFLGTANWEMRFHAGSSFSAAESMRLAETFHRSPIRIPEEVTAGCVAGVSTDNPNVLITHVFPGGAGVVAVRTLNTTDEAQTAVIRWPGQIKHVSGADLDGNGLAPSCEHSPGPPGHWRYSFRPWEIATFRVA